MKMRCPLLLLRRDQNSVAVQDLNDVVTKLGVQRALWLDQRRGKHHFIESGDHCTLLEFA